MRRCRRLIRSQHILLDIHEAGKRDTASGALLRFVQSLRCKSRSSSFELGPGSQMPMLDNPSAPLPFVQQLAKREFVHIGNSYRSVRVQPALRPVRKRA